jgi:hypothetical protein
MYFSVIVFSVLTGANTPHFLFTTVQQEREADWKYGIDRRKKGESDFSFRSPCYFLSSEHFIVKCAGERANAEIVAESASALRTLIPIT